VHRHFDNLVTAYSVKPFRLDTADPVANVTNDAINLAKGVVRIREVPVEKLDGGRPFGGCLATSILQSPEYHKLDPAAKAECDELIERWKAWIKQGMPE
jgi:hypothetical protein